MSNKSKQSHRPTTSLMLTRTIRFHRQSYLLPVLDVVECIIGIHVLLLFLLKFIKKKNEQAGQTAAIDASCWLPKGLSVFLAESGKQDQ